MPESDIKRPPRGLGILALIGPSFVWCAEFIGSGEVILSTRTGAVLGIGVLWAIVVGIFLKYWIGMSGARYTVITGEGMIDMFARIPGPKNWVVWLVLVAQFLSATIAIGSIASAAGVFINSLLSISSYFGGWLVTVFAFMVVWSGVFDYLKIVMSLFVLIIIIGVLYVAIATNPGISELINGFLFKIPAVPDWAIIEARVNPNPWHEVLPLLGWAAGGFASQVWYSYWVIGAEYGAAAGRGYGRPANVEELKNMDRNIAHRIKGWIHVVYADATLAMVIGVVVTASFLIAGAGVLRPAHLAPEGPGVALTLSTIFSSKWGHLGAFLFLLSGTAALVGTQIGQLAGWPRLLADAFRICIPRFKKLRWKIQFRFFLIFFFITNMLIVFTLGLKPVFLVKIGAVLDGLLLTPLQALWVGLGLFLVLPKLLSTEAYLVLKPHWIFALGLLAATIVFGYFCIFQIPFIL